MNIYLTLSIFIVHWLADFVLQTDKMAQGKSKNWEDLINHIVVYTSVWTFFCFLLVELFGYDRSIYIVLPITFTSHTITDYFTSRVNSKLWAEKKVHQFFVSVGFDQVLHYVQLFLCFYYLIK